SRRATDEAGDLLEGFRLGLAPADVAGDEAAGEDRQHLRMALGPVRAVRAVRIAEEIDRQQRGRALELGTCFGYRLAEPRIPARRHGVVVEVQAEPCSQRLEEGRLADLAALMALEVVLAHAAGAQDGGIDAGGLGPILVGAPRIDLDEDAAEIEKQYTDRVRVDNGHRELRPTGPMARIVVDRTAGVHARNQ